jgi:hypothetical protein
MDRRPGNRIKPPAPEPEYARIAVPVRDNVVHILVCTRCGNYVWDLQAHENWHQR